MKPRYQKSFLQPFFQAIVRILMRVLVRLDVQGVENLPRKGPAIITPNHVSWFDLPLVFAYANSAVVSFTAEKWEKHLAARWLLRTFGHAIFVQRGEIDRQALQEALQVLREDAVVGVAPEGTRSYSGVLQAGHDGAAWLAGRTNATVVPVAMWGHEHVLADWRRLRRPTVHMRVGAPMQLPPEARKARSKDLPAYTEIIMRQIAALLPPELRGIYG
ncbi:MAG: 1-acyl-sn-glycerol-3-phosphate acyltransferase [Caldilineales bacterium]|nr:1-acyl-sn-glycerol-3-phosphate acyltransferase [Caldilineales bacterium]